ncbi:NAD(P)H-dependent oxidoreductase (plasmid) [Sphingobium naphthae]|uniref:NAD(P)H-dependent oxidoreductase n=1 Tax=Sphingobium naphthae TaxID=1886786 RepID=UPI000C9159CA|nr:dehydrogenase [Erythrobacter sp.]MEA3390964.1 NAD(P)H-dependent oxidoreductase [Pseudomonadota bacterium]|tara:strand:- start:610 stop:1185 length:576 start_codon:yes stop_codon:yes gene_type:complete
MPHILVIDGHPDASRERFVHALAQTYADAAAEAGHQVERITVAQLDFPILRSQADWKDGPLPVDIDHAQQAILRADHLVVLYPLWLGDMPALLKAFLEQIARPRFAFRYREHGFPEKLLRGRSARVIVTMGMPGLFYRLVYRAHSLKSLERNILAFTGIGPVRHSLIGAVEDPQRRARWLARVAALGRQGA